MILDAHVHLVGNGASGSGCWWRRRGFATSLFAGVMVTEVGLPRSVLEGDLDTAYADNLARLVRESSLDGILAFAQDEVWREDGTRWVGRGTFHVPNSHVLAVAERHPRLLPVCSIHPARPDALEELDRCVAGGAVALKLLPNCHAVDPSRPAYGAFWERLAAAGLPLIAHTGPETALEVVRADLEDPALLEAPLERGVTVIAAHCGAGLVVGDHYRTWEAMLARFPRLHGDTSALPLLNRVHRLRRVARSRVALARVVHGSDVPVIVPTMPAMIAGLIRFPEWRRLRRIANPLERDYRLKRAIGLPEEVFTRMAGLLPRRAVERWTARWAPAAAAGRGAERGA